MLGNGAAVDSTTKYYRDIIRAPTLREDLHLDAMPITVPTLVLACDSDGCFRFEEYEPQRRHFTAGYAFDVIEGGGYFLHREQPEAVARKLLDFVEED